MKLHEKIPTTILYQVKIENRAGEPEITTYSVVAQSAKHALTKVYRHLKAVEKVDLRNVRSLEVRMDFPNE